MMQKKKTTKSPLLDRLNAASVILQVLVGMTGIAGALGYSIFQDAAVFVYRWKLLFQLLILVSIGIGGWILFRLLRQKPPASPQKKIFRASFLGAAVLLLLAISFLIRPAKLSVAILVSGPERQSGEARAEFASLLAGEIQRGSDVLHVFQGARESATETADNAARRLQVDLLIDAQYSSKEGNYVLETQAWDSRKKQFLRIEGVEKLTIQKADLREVAGETARMIINALSLSPFQPLGESRRQTTPYNLYVQGKTYYQWFSLEGYTQAIRCFREAIRLDPEYAPAHAGLSQAYWLEGWYLSNLGDVKAWHEKIELASRQAQEAVRRGPDLPESHLALAYALWNKNDRESTRRQMHLADSLIQASLHLDFKVKSEVCVLRGLVADSLSSAENWYRQAIRYNSTAVLPYEQVASILLKTNRLQEAAAMLEKGAEKITNSAVIYADLAEVYRRLGQPERSLAMVQKSLQLMPGYAYALYQRGFVYAEMGLLNEAIQDCQSALRIKPDVGGIDYGNYRDRVIADFHQDVQYYESLIQRYPNFAFPYLELGKVYISQWYYLWNAGDPLISQTLLRQTKWYYEQVLKMDPSTVITYSSLSDVSSYLGQDSLALEYAQQAARRMPKWAEGWITFGRKLLDQSQNTRLSPAERKKLLARAQKALEKAQDLNPYLWRSWELAADLDYLAGNYQEAGQFYKKALEMVQTEGMQNRLEEMEFLNKFLNDRLSLAQALKWVEDNYYRNRLSLSRFIAGLNSRMSQPTLETRFLHAYLLLKNGDWQEAKERFIPLRPADAYPELKKLGYVFSLVADLYRYENRELADSLGLILQQIEDANSTSPYLNSMLGDFFRGRGEYPEAIARYTRAIQADSTLFEVFNRLGICYNGIKQYDQAAIYYRKALDYEQREAMYWKNLALSYFSSAKYRQAHGAYQQAFALQPRDAEAIYNAGLALKNGNDYPGAVGAFRQAFQINPYQPRYWLALANMLRQQNKAAEAQTVYRQAAALAIRNADYLQEVASILSGEGEYDLAAQYYRKALELEPGNAVAWLALGRMRLEQEKHFAEGVAALQQAARLNPRSAEYQNELGWAYYSHQQYSQALDSYQKAVDLEPGNAVYINRMGLALLEMGKHEEGIAMFRKAAGLDSSNSTYRMNVALGYHRAGKLEQAITGMRAILQQNPENSARWAGLGMLLYEKGDYVEAGDAYRQAAQRDAGNPEHHYQAGNAYLAAQDYSSALQSYAAAARLKPAEPQYCFYHGYCLLYLEEYGEAVQQFQKTLELNPQYTLAWVGIGWSHYYLGEVEPARQAAQKALSLEAENSEAKRLLAKLESAN